MKETKPRLNWTMQVQSKAFAPIPNTGPRQLFTGLWIRAFSVHTAGFFWRGTWWEQPFPHGREWCPCAKEPVFCRTVLWPSRRIPVAVEGTSKAHGGEGESLGHYSMWSHIAGVGNFCLPGSAALHVETECCSPVPPDFCVLKGRHSLYWLSLPPPTLLKKVSW